MDSSLQSFFFNFMTLFLLLSISAISHTNASDAPKVTLSLYYETLCPGCQDFTTNNLADSVNSDLMTITNVRLVPYGNAEIIPSNQTIDCQHGPDECYFNTIEACAIHAWPDVQEHYPFIDCLEAALTDKSGGRKPNDPREVVWKTCCQKLNLKTKPISDCYSSGLGEKLIRKNGNETDNLKPPHEYVPWVVVDGQALKDDLLNYVEYVCKAYKGEILPKACNTARLSSDTVSTKKFDPEAVSYASEEAKISVYKRRQNHN